MAVESEANEMVQLLADEVFSFDFNRIFVSPGSTWPFGPRDQVHVGTVATRVSI